MRFRAKSLAPPLTIFVVNVWICWRLFHTEYLDDMLSIEGAFISLARYIERRWPMYDWFPMWRAGFPFPHAYQPLLHYSVAAFARLTGLSPALSYHFLTALAYSLGGVAFYFLALALTRSRWASFCGALLFSTFSPSLLLVKQLRADTWGWENARRLKVMVVFGEGPNIAGLTLAMVALAMTHRALARKTRGSAIAAAIAIALVPATNWPATLALMMALAGYALAFGAREFLAKTGRLTAIGLAATALALPIALPGTILSTARNTNMMEDAPTQGAARWIAIAVVMAAVALVRLAVRRAPFGIRFAALFSAISGGIVISAAYAHISPIAQPMRFHVAMEIGLTLLLTLAGYAACSRWPRVAKPLVAALLLFCAAQAWHYRKYARSIVHPVDIANTLEYKEARWFDANAHGERVDAPGSVSFWMNAFTDTPQLLGCCEQSLPSHEDFIVAYLTATGFRSDAESADYSLLWEKAFAATYFGAGGPGTREYYRSVSFPNRFRGRLPLVWRDGDDYIYRIPERAPGLMRVVRTGDVVRDAPENGIDVKELRPFVAALDDASLPVAATAWRDVNHARIRAKLTRDEVISFAMNYDPGWKARVNGRAAAVLGDGLGLTIIEPDCDGDCTIDLRWSAGAEPWLCCAISALTFAGALLWWARGGAYGQSART